LQSQNGEWRIDFELGDTCTWPDNGERKRAKGDPDGALAIDRIGENAQAREQFLRSRQPCHRPALVHLAHFSVARHDKLRASTTAAIPFRRLLRPRVWHDPGDDN
jgi:hypothetical protein